MTLKKTATIGGPLLWGLAIIALLCVPLSAQTWTVIHSFNGLDGAGPAAGLTMDAAGNLYGTTSGGGGAVPTRCGTVYKLAHTDAGWVRTTLYMFNCIDGAGPSTRVIFGPDGALYGTTSYGGNGYGTVYRLQPPRSCRSENCSWTETVLYSFRGQGDGWNPGYADLAFDQQGNVYGTTEMGGACNGYCGVVFKLTRSGSSWNFSVLYSFQGGSDGANPIAGVVLDSAGNLYGTALNEGSGGGVVFELSPSGSSQTESVLYNFQVLVNADSPQGGLIFDRYGDLYGTARYGGDYGTGTVFELAAVNGGWAFGVLASLPGLDGYGPVATLALDDHGALYGTTLDGSVFKLAPSGDTWILTELGNGGPQMTSSVVVDSNGVIYGTDAWGGAYNHGYVFELTQ